MVEGYGFTEVLVNSKQIISNSVNVSMLLSMRTRAERPKGPKCKVDLSIGSKGLQLEVRARKALLRLPAKLIFSVRIHHTIGCLLFEVPDPIIKDRVHHHHTVAS